MTLFRYDEAPAVGIEIDGRTATAIIDTANADTLVMPRGRHPAGRAKAHIVVAGIDFGKVDIRYADVSDTRLGNRLLSKFLISIDYGKRVVGLWRDPRIRM
ncbi:MAG TPA: hypothetical protein VEZ11_18675 [Thermoanaerobaculia bacterium]|nr:hypothetical protein [Thermoanaerobaculia bacterium]